MVAVIECLEPASGACDLEEANLDSFHMLLKPELNTLVQLLARCHTGNRKGETAFWL